MFYKDVSQIRPLCSDIIQSDIWQLHSFHLNLSQGSYMCKQCCFNIQVS